MVRLFQRNLLTWPLLLLSGKTRNNFDQTGTKYTFCSRLHLIFYLHIPCLVNRSFFNFNQHVSKRRRSLELGAHQALIFYVSSLKLHIWQASCLQSQDYGNSWKWFELNRVSGDQTSNLVANQSEIVYDGNKQSHGWLQLHTLNVDNLPTTIVQRLLTRIWLWILT